jgi:ferric-dicitrate binding protein FerR (iron transport regulator)
MTTMRMGRRYPQAGAKNDTRLEYATSTGRWLTEDRCGSTKVKVKRGKVSVRDSGRGKTKLVRKGRALTVRAR